MLIIDVNDIEINKQDGQIKLKDEEKFRMFIKKIKNPNIFVVINKIDILNEKSDILSKIVITTDSSKLSHDEKQYPIICAISCKNDILIPQLIEKISSIVKFEY